MSVIKRKGLKDFLEGNQSLMKEVSFEDMQPTELPIETKAMEIAYKSYMNVIDSLKATERTALI